jgi:hypothetical protein
VSAAPPPELDAEQEVDFGRYWRVIASRWWLVVGGLVAGLIIGYLVALGTNSTSYKATALVYLGQPLAPDSAAPVSSSPTTLGLVSNLVTSSATVRAVAKKVGLKEGRLSHHITTKPVLGVTATKVGTPAPLLAITVTGTPAKKIRNAANELADVAINAVGGYSRVKIAKLKEQIDFDNQSIARNNDRSRRPSACSCSRTSTRRSSPSSSGSASSRPTGSPPSSSSRSPRASSSRRSGRRRWR